MSVTRTESGEVGALAESPQEAFARLLKPHLRRLYRLAFRLTDNTADAEDLLQDVLLKLFQRADELSSIVDLRPWTGRVLYNCFVDRRRHMRRKRRLEVVAPHPTDTPGADEMHQVPSTALGPEDDTALALDMKRLDNALAQLSDEHRLLVILHDAEGCTLEEITAITALPLGTVKSRLHRARQRLRELCGDGTLFS